MRGVAINIRIWKDGRGWRDGREKELEEEKQLYSN